MPFFPPPHLTPADDAYYDTLQELDNAYPWGASYPTLQFRSSEAQGEPCVKAAQPRLLVCHDYKGGYQDKPNAFGYTFNFWSLADTFVYFAHHRVSPPPATWITAAHRQGSKVLGTLIFERSGEEDCLRLLIGPVPTSDSGSASTITTSGFKISMSTHYADLLAEFANHRGFDGWLLNFECPLAGGETQARLVAAWIVLLKKALLLKVGPHSEVVWYDSVTVDGYLRWQDRLCSRNLPFFLSANSIFTNYTWRTDYPRMSAEYLDTVEKRVADPKTRKDIYIGVDVWGRGCHGGGGFNTYKALEHIAPSPDGLGLSVALFGPAWTYESKQDDPLWTWRTWWRDEVRYWIGNLGSSVSAESPSPKEMPWPSGTSGKEPCTHGPYRAISSFFNHRSTSLDTPFFTTFSPGVGYSWFVEGARVGHMETGWTDVDKQTSIGHGVWPAPTFVLHTGERLQNVPHGATDFCFSDAWLGGSSLAINVPSSLLRQGSDSRDTTPPSTTLTFPVQSFTFRSSKTYNLRLVTKFDDHGEVILSFSPVKGVDTAKCLTLGTSTSLTNGWSILNAKITIPSSESVSSVEMTVEVGLQGLPFINRDFSILLIGLLAIEPDRAMPSEPTLSSLAWTSDVVQQSNTAVSGTLEWQTTTYLPPAVNPSPPITNVEDPTPRWTFHLDDQNAPHSRPAWYSDFAFQNFYVQPHSPSSSKPLDPTNATFIGTSSVGGALNTVPLTLPNAHSISNRVRLYARGVLDTGSIVPWEKSTSIDITLTG